MEQYIITETYSKDLWNLLADDGILWLLPTDEPEQQVMDAQADGWIRRNTIVWCGECEVRFVYFLVKQQKYHFNQLREDAYESYKNDKRPPGVLRQRLCKNTKYADSPYSPMRGLKKGEVSYAGKQTQQCHGPEMAWDGTTRNKRCVWFCDREELLETLKKCSIKE